MIISLTYILWSVLFLLIAAGVLMLSYWIVTREKLAFQQAILVQVGLFIFNLVLGSFIGLMPLREILWILLVAAYFMLTLKLSFVRALILTLLQRVIYFLFVMAILAPPVAPVVPVR